MSKGRVIISRQGKEEIHHLQQTCAIISGEQSQPVSPIDKVTGQQDPYSQTRWMEPEEMTDSKGCPPGLHVQIHT